MSDAGRWTPDQSVIDAARSRSTPLRDLSEMDRSVVIAALTLDGWTSARMADRLVCSLRTVQEYRARPATRAVRYALEVRRELEQVKSTAALTRRIVEQDAVAAAARIERLTSQRDALVAIASPKPQGTQHVSDSYPARGYLRA